MNKRTFGSIEPREDRPGFYVRFSWRGTRYRRYGGLSRTIAEARLAKVRAILDREGRIEAALSEVFGDFDGTKLTLREAVEPYLAFASARRKPSTVVSLRQTLALISRASWSAKQLREIRAAEIQTWTTERVTGGVSGATVNRNLNAISGLFRWAIRCGHVVDNPVRRVERFSEKGRARETYLDAEEARALVESCRDGIRDLVMAALHTGMRRGELISLRWRSIDLVRREIVIEAANEKAGRGRVVPMTGELHSRLTELRASHSRTVGDGDAVFRLRDGTEISAKMVRSRFEAAVNRCAGIPSEKRSKVTFHCLRHTAASLMVSKGVPLFDVAKILGHSTLAVTMRYAHFAPAAARAGIEKLGEALRDPASASPTGVGRVGGVAEGQAALRVRRSA